MKIINKLKSMLSKLKHILDIIFNIYCPECGGELHSEFYNSKLDKMVYICNECGKRFI